MPDRPTRLQRKIQKDLRAIVDELGFNFEEISSIKKEYRTLFLHGIRVTIVRGVIVEKYVMLDERLSSIVAAFFFKKKNFIQLWRTKRFTLFDYYILEKLSLREKLLLVRAIRRVPKRVFEATERINAVRNVVAHNFFPENVRDLRDKKKGRASSIPGVYPYKGENVFTLAGLKLFLEDVGRVVSFIPYPSLSDLEKSGKRRRGGAPKLSTLTQPPDVGS